MYNLNFDIWKFGHPQCANSANGTLSKLTWSGDMHQDVHDGYEWKDAPSVALDITMTNADFSNKHLGVSGAMILAAFISRKSFQDNGAMSKLDLGDNDIFRSTQSDQETAAAANALASMLKMNSSITDLNVSSNWMKAAHAQVLAPAIQDNGAMSILNVSNNYIGAEGAKALVPAM